jgi:hypothetical protein
MEGSCFSYRQIWRILLAWLIGFFSELVRGLQRLAHSLHVPYLPVIWDRD